ncbi:hypothetical protein SGFS_003460 [Streptomyces graminofaciens]|uniref:Transposase IS4 N-terminal domain-containing protein n=1 Tax=Streptomyces graminofaciens TaxID=68212 RepID=A0ABN5V7Z9_9ACTN|nr:hypothetical protein SGFS_003460 [Streptomyces graminofaciens]
MAQSVTGGTDDVFAPGHAGELTQVIPPELVDAALDESGARERRLRSLPSRGGVYFVLALGLFEHLGTGLVWSKLGAGLAARVPQPSEKAPCDLRRRVGVAPLERLFDVLAGALAQPSTPGVHCRTVAFDGCGSLSVPRERITSGNLAELIANRYVVGVTTSPAIFQVVIPAAVVRTRGPTSPSEARKPCAR